MICKIKQKHTKHTTIYTVIKNGTQRIRKNVIKKSHKSSKFRTIYISSNNVRHPVTKTFFTLHPTTLHSTSLNLTTLHFLSFKIHPTTLHYLLIWFNLRIQKL